MSWYRYAERVDWEKLRRSYPDQNDAIKVLQEDFNRYDHDDNWAFLQWLKSDNIDIDRIVSRVKRHYSMRRMR